MTKDEYENLRPYPNSSRGIKIEDLVNTEGRTLLYGYSTDRDAIHVYLKDRKFYLYRYNVDRSVSSLHIFGEHIEDVSNLIPNKRLYPECCDEEFCQILISLNIYLPFTNFYEYLNTSVYYGAIAE